MNKKRVSIHEKLLLSIIPVMLVAGCSSGSLRAFNDAMSERNGYKVTYPDQSRTKYVGDVRFTTGVKSGSGFVSLKNTGDDYCKVQLTYEDGSNRVYNLDPGESTGRSYVSVYNQVDSARTLCNTTSRVFSSSFD